MIKCIFGLGAIDWFERALDLDIVLLLRHPIPCALSRERGLFGSAGRQGRHSSRAARLPVRAMSNLEHSEFVSRHLSARQLALGRRILDEGGPLEQHVLEWALDYLVPLRLFAAASHDWTVVTYEELLAYPDASADLLTRRLRLSGAARLRSRMDVPSVRTATGTPASDAQRSKLERIARWRQRVGTAEEERLFEILRGFGIEAYQPGRDFAADPFLQFDVPFGDGLIPR